MGFILRDKKAEKECTSKIQLTPQYKYTKSKFDTQIKEMLLTEQTTEKKTIRTQECQENNVRSCEDILRE